MRRPILNFILLLVPGVLLNFIPNSVQQSLGITNNLLKKSFKINSRQKNFGCLVLILVLVLIKTDFNAKKQSCKWDMASINDASRIEILLPCGPDLEFAD